MSAAPTLAEYRAALRSDYYLFLARCYATLHAQASFLPNWHIEVMAEHLDAVRRGEIKRLIINIPPRRLKSLAASIVLPAWWLGHDPTASIINVTYAQDLTDKLARDCRSIMNSSWYQALFPTRLRDRRMALQEVATTQGGFRLATSVGGVLTGRGGDVIIIDDPLKPDEAVSETRRKAVNAWYDGTLVSRLNDKRTGAIIVIMQRLHEDDLVGYLTAREAWHVVSFPAIAEEDESHAITTPFGVRRFARRAGEALHPAREPIETLERLRRTIGDYNFSGQYQQRPAPLGGGMVKAAWFKRYEATDLPATFHQVIQSWDTANKPTELADYSVCTTWGMKGPVFYLLNVMRKKLSYPDLKRAVHEQKRSFGPTVILIEDKASGTQLIQDLIEEGVSMVIGCQPEGDKIMRLHAQTATMENGFVYLPTEAHWVDDYLREMLAFPNGRHDDQVDATAQAFAWTKLRSTTTGCITYYERQAAKKAEGHSPNLVRLRTPEGISNVYLRNGECRAIHDRMIEVSELDAVPLTAAGFERLSV